MMKGYLIIILFFFCTAVSAQFTVTSLSLNSNAAWLSYKFPYVKSENKKAAIAVNSYLQKQVLENDTVFTDSVKVFKHSRYSDESGNFRSGYSSLDYEVLLNNKKLFSLAINIESTGAYSEYYSRYYSFDTQTGKPLTAKELFTSKGMEALDKKIKAIRRKNIKAWMKELKREEGFAEDSATITQTFKECNQLAGLQNFSVQKDTITFRKGYCFPHAMRPMDTNLDVSFSVKELQAYLSESGKRLMK